jgi:hypothetical protein
MPVLIKLPFKLCLTLVLLLTSLFCTATSALSAIQDTIVVQGTPIRQDSISSTIAKRIINRDFNNIYLQNLKTSFFGQEYFQPIKTQLVGDVVANFVVFDSPKSRVFVNAFTRIKIRLLSAQGAPVKSPSYMPGIELFYRLNSNIYKPQFMSLGFTHHSNGIRGSTIYPDGNFNVDSGKFATNFFTLNYTNGKRHDYTNYITNRYSTIGVELHTGLFTTKGIAVGLPGRYGFFRINGTYMFNVAKKYADPIKTDNWVFNNWQRLQFDFTYIADDYQNYNTFNFKKRLNVSLKYYYNLPFLRDMAIVAGGGYRGQDDYNIYFQNTYGYAMIGLSSGLSFLVNK